MGERKFVHGTMPIYGKNPVEIFSETVWQMTLKLCIQYWALGSTRFVQMMTLG